jgi:hypothetical protein
MFIYLRSLRLGDSEQRQNASTFVVTNGQTDLLQDDGME